MKLGLLFLFSVLLDLCLAWCFILVWIYCLFVRFFGSSLFLGLMFRVCCLFCDVFLFLLIL